MRIKCIVAYDGTLFHGWQIQPNVRSVQEEIQKALYKITHEEIVIHSSGRTDAHVHARNQVFHFDTSKELPEKQWIRAINHFLPEDVYIKDSFIVDESFHARYSAVAKEYHYLLSTNEYNPFMRNYIYQYPYGKLDLEIMQSASKVFIGEHDFGAYCVYDHLGTTTRTLFDFEIEEENGLFTFILKGNGFRRYMVRHIVGGIIQVGAHRKDIPFLENLLLYPDKKCLFKAEPQGLYLERVFYNDVEA